MSGHDERLQSADRDELLRVAIAAAQLGGELLRERFARGEARGVVSKSTPTDPVSEADLASERAIRELLAQRRPQDGFVGEEGDEDAGSSGLRWVVDPLDGTVDFLFGIPQWCVSVAVKDEQGSLAGAIYDPCREELFTAVRGGAAMLHLLAQSRAGPRATGRHAFEPADPALRELSGPEPRELSGPPPRELAQAMVATGFAYDARVRAAQAQALTRVLPRVRDIRRFGSAALDLAWTAAGRFDAYFERTVKQWDIAAGTLICEAAGLTVRELPTREDLPWGILVARAERCEELFALVG